MTVDRSTAPARDQVMISVLDWWKVPQALDRLGSLVGFVLLFPELLLLRSWVSSGIDGWYRFVVPRRWGRWYECGIALRSVSFFDPESERERKS